MKKKADRTIVITGIGTVLLFILFLISNLWWYKTGQEWVVMERQYQDTITILRSTEKVPVFLPKGPKERIKGVLINKYE